MGEPCFGKGVENQDGCTHLSRRGAQAVAAAAQRLYKRQVLQNEQAQQWRLSTTVGGVAVRDFETRERRLRIPLRGQVVHFLAVTV